MSGIFQDDNDDWKEAAAAIAEIYKDSYLTTSVTWAGNSDCGLFYHDPNRYKIMHLKNYDLSIREKPVEYPILEQCIDPSEPTKEFPLLHRAWQSWQQSIKSIKFA